MANTLYMRRILLIISGGIAAYKSLDLIRRLREAGAEVNCVLTQGGAQFVTPLAVASLSERPVHTDLWSLTDQAQMDHIRLSRDSDLIVIAPASANLLAKMAQGLADDLASTLLLASDKPVLAAPAMNVLMWQHPATQANIATLIGRGVRMIGPASGELACGEQGAGRMAEVTGIVEAVVAHCNRPGPLTGQRALVTSGPTYEPIDPVRFIGNRSSGKQGHAIAAALRRAGADTVLVTGPTHQPDPAGVQVIKVNTAVEMLAACKAQLPVGIAVCAAAVADWQVAQPAVSKLKKTGTRPQLDLIETPDILAHLSQAARRPRLVIGFAAETDHLLAHAQAKLERKGCDWLLANEVGEGLGFEQDDNQVTLLRRVASGEIESNPWPKQSKLEIAERLVEEIAVFFA